MGQIKDGVEFDSFDEFVEKVKGMCPHFVCRGLSKYSYKLKTRIGRKIKYPRSSKSKDEYIKKEKTIFETFKSRARIHAQSSTYNLWEWLAMAQHYGVPTRLLDWSDNPLVALYFAAKDHPKDDGAVLFHHTSSLLNTAGISPFESNLNGFLLAPYVTHRLAAQGSIFSIDSEPWKEFNSNQEDIIKCRISADFKEELRLLLPRIGLNRRALFADLDSYVSEVEQSFDALICPHGSERLID